MLLLFFKKICRIILNNNYWLITGVYGLPIIIIIIIKRRGEEEGLWPKYGQTKYNYWVVLMLKLMIQNCRLVFLITFLKTKEWKEAPRIKWIKKMAKAKAQAQSCHVHVGWRVGKLSRQSHSVPHYLQSLFFFLLFNKLLNRVYNNWPKNDWYGWLLFIFGFIHQHINLNIV